jgi:hypothetical protein
MPAGASRREERPGGDKGLADEAGRVLEAGRLNAGCVWGREHDYLGLARVLGDVGLEPAVDEQAEPIDGGVERPFGARPSGRQGSSWGST